MQDWEPGNPLAGPATAHRIAVGCAGALSWVGKFQSYLATPGAEHGMMSQLAALGE